MAISTLSCITAGALPAAARQAPTAPDGLSGTWRVSRTCLTICTSPQPVLKVVHHLSGRVFVTAGAVRQTLYLTGTQVLVHGPKDSLILTVRTRGQLMSGYGVGTDGSTFTSTWRCVAASSTAARLGTATGNQGGFQPRSIEHC
jgi:hypothetical protein